MLDKQNEPMGSAPENWRQKVAPIPTFLQKDTGEVFIPAPPKEKGGLMMKGFLATIITGALGAAMGYGISYFGQSPGVNPTASLNQLVSQVKTQADTILNQPGPQKPADPANGATPLSPSVPVLGGAPTAQNPAPPANAASPGASSPAPSVAPAATPAAASAAPSTPAALPAEPKKEEKKTSPVPGPVYMAGTNPYGPPPLVEDDLFNANSMLAVEYDPTPAISKGPYGESFSPPATFKELIKETPTQPTLAPASFPEPEVPSIPQSAPTFHVQLGAFISRINANQLADKMAQKGYEVTIYEGSARNHPTWYYVRLNKEFDQVGALNTVKRIHATENFVPAVVQQQTHEKKIR